jgi:hypothetical protein
MKNRLQGSKSDVKVSDLASNATHAHTIDVKGFSQASIDVAFEPVAAAGTNSAVANVLTLQHGDTTSTPSRRRPTPTTRPWCGSTSTSRVRSVT